MEGDVSPLAWERIANALDAQDAKRRPLFWWWLAGVLVVGIASVFMYFNWSSSPSTTTIESFHLEDSVMHNSQVNLVQKENISEKDDASSVIEKNSNTKEISSVKRTNTHKSNATEQSEVEYIIPSFNEMVIQMRPISGFGNFSLANPTLSIFNAPEIGADDFYKIPTINKGKQKDHQDPKNKGLWELGLSASPALAARLIQTTNSTKSGLLNKYYQEKIDGKENSGNSYQLSFNVNRYLTKSLYISTSVQYDRIIESVSYDHVIDSYPHVNYNESKIEGYSPRPAEYVQYNGNNTYQFIEIPVKFGIVVTVFRDKLTLRTQAGVQYMYLLSKSGSKIDATYLDLVNVKSSNLYNKNNFGGMISTGLYYGFGTKLEFGAQYYFQRNFTSMKSNEAVLLNTPMSYGFNLSLNYKLLSKTK